MEKRLIEKVIDEAKAEEANLVIWDRRDTFTVESDDIDEIETNEDHLRVAMQDGKAVVYVEYDYIYKLVLEKERSARPGVRAGFGASS
ncbi:hypothetical protein AVDCRST_MAG82-284 [uncultured Rubrobacteraceae bacterium]|uniref:Uncharacterized protein n=1 Tax=uncultured Rubrobacteraceae bacterium TaxID=349277 RepID=A0A6J4P2F8_9ACTN|nr:hypothetical protein AVDCRST_MAG82-284 [uncultured Rubrobacteraceae bacterium]